MKKIDPWKSEVGGYRITIDRLTVSDDAVYLPGFGKVSFQRFTPIRGSSHDIMY